MSPFNARIPEETVVAANETQAGIVDGPPRSSPGRSRTRPARNGSPPAPTLDDAGLLAMDWYVEGVQS